jgi:hypothetical protein
MCAFVKRSIPKNTKRLVVFLTPGVDKQWGGILSIAAHYKETRRLSDIHGARVLLAILPGDPWLLKYTWFRNDNYMVPFQAVLRRFTNVDWLMVHVPEYAVNQVLTALTPEERVLLGRPKVVHFNVMIQNIDQIEGQHIQALQCLGKVTCTTGHEAYCSEAVRHNVGVPLHRLSVCVDLGQCFQTPYREKEELLLVSPDPHPSKEEVLAKIQKAYPDLRIQIIHSLSNEQYKQLISRAKWSLTFGEGLDGYFVEVILSGGVGFAVYNERFFTSEYSALESVYPSWDALAQRIVPDLARLDEPQAYERCWRQAFNLIATKYGIKMYRDNLSRFYLEDYTFP